VHRRVRYELFLAEDPARRSAAKREIASRFGRSPATVAEAPPGSRLERFCELRLRVRRSRVWEVARELAAIDGVVDVDPEVPLGHRVDRAIAGLETAAEREQEREGPRPSTDWYHQQSRFPEAIRFARAEQAEGRGCWSGGETGIRIGQLDTGYSDHPDVRKVRKEQGWNCVVPPPWIRWLRPGWRLDPRDPLVMAPPFRWASHGTSAASIMVGLPTEGRGLQEGHEDRSDGVFPHVDLVPYRIGNSIISTGILLARGIARAVGDGCRVLTMSHASVVRSRLLIEAVAEAYERGVFCVAAAGSHLRKLWFYPARLPEVIAVAATTIDGEPWQWNNSRSSAEICAPGTDIYRPFARRRFLGLFGRPRYGYGWSEGTTYATPVVASAAALWLAHHGDAALQERYPEGWQQIEAFRRLLRQTAAPHRDPASCDCYGAGLLHVEALLRAPLPAAAELVRAGEQPLDETGEDAVDRVADKELIWLCGAGKVQTEDRSGDELFRFVRRHASRATGRLLDGLEAPEEADDYARANPRSEALKQYVARASDR